MSDKIRKPNLGKEIKIQESERGLPTTVTQTPMPEVKPPKPTEKPPKEPKK